MNRPERRSPTHVLRIEVPLNLKGNPAAEEWDVRGAMAEALRVILPLVRVGTLGLLCDDPVVTTMSAETIDSFSDVAVAVTCDEAWRYGFRWGPMVVERSTHVEGRGYVLTVRTEYQSVEVYVTEKGRRIEAMPVHDVARDA